MDPFGIDSEQLICRCIKEEDIAYSVKSRSVEQIDRTPCCGVADGSLQHIDHSSIWIIAAYNKYSELFLGNFKILDSILTVIILDVINHRNHSFLCDISRQRTAYYKSVI